MLPRVPDHKIEVTVNDDGVCRIVKGTVCEWLPDGVVFSLNCPELELGSYPLQIRNLSLERAQTFGEYEPSFTGVVDIETRVLVEEVRSRGEDATHCKVRAKYQGSVRILNHLMIR